MVRNAIGHIRLSWATLALTGLGFKLLTFVVLTPIVAILFRLFVALSGRVVLADTEILFFIAHPGGWICFVTVGALWLAIVSLEQAALIHILEQRSHDYPVGALAALRFALSHLRPVLRLCARIAALTLLVLLPMLAALAIVYITLLSKYDINFYLAHRPPAFWWSIICGALILVPFAVVFLRLFTGWVFALPLVLLENCDVAESLRVSRECADGRRMKLISWLVGWILMTTVVSAFCSGVCGVIGQQTISSVATSLPLLTFAVGALMIVWSVATVAVNLFGTISFAVLLFVCYEDLERDSQSREATSAKSNPGSSLIRFELTWKRIFLATAIGVVVAISVGIGALNTIQLEDQTQITAHRGASGRAPENTLAAVKAAIQQGADWVEIDVQETADGHVVVFHDSDFKRVAGNELKIWDATLRDLEDVDIGSWFAPEFNSERVPTLAQVLETCKGKVGVNIELKYYGREVRLEERVIEVVEAHNIEQEIVIMSLKQPAVQKIRNLRPSWTVGQLSAVTFGDLNRVDADFLAVSPGVANRNFIRRTQSSGRQVHVWTINDRLTMSIMVGRGVDNIITDEPALLRSVLEKRAKLTVTERALLSIADLFGTKPKFSEQ